MSIAITGARVVPVVGDAIDGGTVLFEAGKIVAVEGPGFAVPADAEVVDAAGKWVLPGFIDAHAHLGLHEEAEGWAGSDTNELTRPVTAYVRALDGINPAEQGFRDAIGGGVLSVNINPGSGNPIGGQTVAVKCWGRVVDQMVLRQPSGLKSALGENPKRVYGERHETPSTRLGVAAVIREAFVQAGNYLAKLAAADGVAEALLGRVDPVQRADVRGDRLGQLVHVPAGPSLGLLVQAQVCMRVDEAGQHPLASGVDHLGVGRHREARPLHRDDLPGLEQDRPAVDGLAHHGDDPGTRNRRAHSSEATLPADP